MTGLVITLRTAPTRLFGPYGCEWIDTPHLDRLAASGIVFDNHYATNPGQTHSGFYVETVNGFKFDTIRRKLKRSEAGWIQIVIDPFELPWNGWNDGSIDLNDEEKQEEFFTVATEAVTQFDEEFGSFLDAFLDQFGETTSLVLSADSGLPMCEHGILGVSQSRLHQELVHLPFIVRMPGGQLAGERVARMTGDDELAAILGMPSVDEWEPFVNQLNSSRDLFSVRGLPFIEAALRSADTTFLLPLVESNDRSMLFERPDDRHEVNDLHKQFPDRAEECERRIQDWLKNVPTP